MRKYWLTGGAGSIQAAWMTKKELLDCTPKVLCDECLTFTNPATYADADPQEFAQAVFERDVLPHLLDTKKYEVRGSGRDWKIRCLNPVGSRHADLEPLEANEHREKKNKQPVGKGAKVKDKEVVMALAEEELAVAEVAKKGKTVAGALAEEQKQTVAGLPAARPYDWKADVFHRGRQAVPGAARAQVSGDEKRHPDTRPASSDPHGRWQGCRWAWSVSGLSGTEHQTEGGRVG